MRIHLQLISSQEALPLRHLILRPEEPITQAQYDNDDFATTFHVGAFFSGRLVGVASCVLEDHAALSTNFGLEQEPFRLRGMATDFSFRRKGVGRQVLEYGIAEMQKRGGTFLWCKARQVAFPFYEQLGFHYFGELFDIPGIALHKVMYKEL